MLTSSDDAIATFSIHTGNKPSYVCMVQRHACCLCCMLNGSSIGFGKKGGPLDGPGPPCPCPFPVNGTSEAQSIYLGSKRTSFYGLAFK